ncbi:hypothetical protein [Neoactinobaculum massilliense]|uniref:hypothetical protein n=1 Tax=Neoactinobaculum massilliense TaxID=2364794 RepID=UPI000F51F36F|nr:hypothetical protein [Neoactinobaculum massilliense]
MSYSGQFYGGGPQGVDPGADDRCADVSDADIIAASGPGTFQNDAGNNGGRNPADATHSEDAPFHVRMEKPASTEGFYPANREPTGYRSEDFRSRAGFSRTFSSAATKETGWGGVVASRVRHWAWVLLMANPFLVMVVRLAATPVTAGTAWLRLFITVPVLWIFLLAATITTQLGTLGKRRTSVWMPVSYTLATLGFLVYAGFAPFFADFPGALPATYGWISSLAVLTMIGGYLWWWAELCRAVGQVPDALR